MALSRHHGMTQSGQAVVRQESGARCLRRRAPLLSGGGVTPSINIAGITFPTKIAVERHIRDIFKRTVPMTPLGGPDLIFVSVLLDIHPLREHIVGSGIRHHGVECVPNAPDQRRFVIRRTDGSLRDWSWRDALTPESPLKRLTGVLRYLISGQILSFRNNTPERDCYNCRVALSSDSHVDHVAPNTFESLVRQWTHINSLTPESIEIQSRSGYGQHSTLADSRLSVNWENFHRSNAVLAMACRKCNLSVLRRK